MYDEADFFTIENIACIKEKTGTQDAPAWRLLESHYAAFSHLLSKVRRTLTYNDFYYTNMVVAQDKSSALMFDYNLLGKGSPMRMCGMCYHPYLGKLERPFSTHMASLTP